MCFGLTAVRSWYWNVGLEEKAEQESKIIWCYNHQNGLVRYRTSPRWVKLDPSQIPTASAASSTSSARSYSLYTVTPNHEIHQEPTTHLPHFRPPATPTPRQYSHTHKHALSHSLSLDKSNKSTKFWVLGVKMLLVSMLIPGWWMVNLCFWQLIYLSVYPHTARMIFLDSLRGEKRGGDRV